MLRTEGHWESKSILAVIVFQERMQRDGGAGSVGSAANSDHKEVRNVTGTVAPGDTLEDAKVTARGTGIVELCTLCICLIADC